MAPPRHSSPDTAAAERSLEKRPLVEWVGGPLDWFTARESSGGIVLLVGTVLGLAWANSPWAGSYEALWARQVGVTVGSFAARGSLHHLINDGLMAVFFFSVGLEIKREVLVGELARVRQAALPLAGAAGGMLVPAAIYAALNVGGVGARGWGVPVATDIAFALGVLVLLGDRVPGSLKVFLAALAIADDIGAVLVIAVFYSSGVVWSWLSVAAALLLLAAAANYAGVRRPSVYAGIGVTLWAAVLRSGLHATVAGVLLAFTIPSRTRIDEREFLASGRRTLDDFDAAFRGGPPKAHPRLANRSALAATVLTHETIQEALHRLERLCEYAQPPLHRLERALYSVVTFGILPLFAFANAGVPLHGRLGAALGNPVTLGVALGLVLGKPLGIAAFSWLAVRLGGAAKPEGVSWRELRAVSWLGGIGFTMSLFIAGLAFSGPGAEPLLEYAKVGVLGASLVAGSVGWVVMRRVMGR